MNNVEIVKLSPLYGELEKCVAIFNSVVDAQRNISRKDAQVEVERDRPELVPPVVLHSELMKAAQRLDDLSAERVRPGEEHRHAAGIANAKVKLADLQTAAQRVLETAS